MKAIKEKIKLTTIELSDTDKSLLKYIKEKTNAKSNAQVLRTLIREYYMEIADKKNIKYSFGVNDGLELWLIYSDDYSEWDSEINEYLPTDEIIGGYLDAHQFGRRKYGKKYCIKKYTQ
jgi:hypothetical protein